MVINMIKPMQRWIWLSMFIVGSFATVAPICAEFYGSNIRGSDPCDLGLRYNESLCAHTGVNPFKIWNGDVASEEFRGLPVPGKPADKSPEKKQIHAYPPWHMAFTWFYGSISYCYTIAIMYFVYGISLCVMIWTVQRYFGIKIFLPWMLMCIGAPIGLCITTGNYSIFEACLVALLMLAIERNKQIAAGIIWSIMMIKPQIAALWVVPLVLDRKYLSIIVAGGICFAATFLTYLAYGSAGGSIIDLILQVPQIGAPYNHSRIFPDWALHVWLFINVVLCVCFSWKFRNSQNCIIRYVAPSFFFMYWTYGTLQDHVAGWPFFLLLGVWYFSMNRSSRRFILFTVVSLFVLFSVAFTESWRLFMCMHLFVPTGIGWIYRIFEYGQGVAFYMMGILMLITLVKKGGKAVLD